MDRAEATERYGLVRSRHKAVPSVASIWDGTPRCVRDGVRIFEVKGRTRTYWQHDRGEIGTLLTLADLSKVKIK